MQKNVGKNTKKLYLLTSIIALLVVLAISLTLIFTLGARSSSGSGDKNGSNTNSTANISTEIYNGSTKITSLSLGANATAQVNVKNTSDIAVYLRARVILTGATKNVYFDFGSDWVYAADNYLYYKNAVPAGQNTTQSGTSASAGYLITKINGNTSDVTVRFVVEALQKEAAIPSVTFNSTTKIGGQSGDTAPNGGLSASSNALQNGLIRHYLSVDALSSATATKNITIENKGKQDLDVKFRIASSEWMVESGAIGSTTKNIDWDANAGYYHLVGKLAVGQTLTITLADANKNNNISAPATTVDFTLQDYVVATDVYSLVNKSTLQNVGTLVSGTTSTYTVSGSDATNLAIYSYNNVNKFVYVKVTSTSAFTFGSEWGQLEGEVTGVSGAVLKPKSISSKLFGTVTSSGTYTIKVWTAQIIDNPTVSVVKATSGLNGASNNYVASTNATASAITQTSELVLSATTSATANTIKEKWGNLAVKSGDTSEMLVRVSLSFSWGTLSGQTWTASNDELGFSPSAFYGNGFSFNSEDQSLTYNYNLACGACSSALLEFDNDTTELATMVSKINEKNSALKLTIMVEAIYAVGSQLDIWRLESTPTASGNYYTTEAIGINYISMTKVSGIISGTASELADDLSNYVVYATNNFPVGIRVAVALQWGTYSNGTWTPATSANSSVNIGEYLTDKWTWDDELGGYNYVCSIPGKCATLAIFDSTKLAGLATELSDSEETSAHSGEVLRVVIMAETTHKI